MEKRVVVSWNSHRHFWNQASVLEIIYLGIEVRQNKAELKKS